MAPRLITFLIILLANLAIGAVWFFFLLMALNGFSSEDAQWGIIAFVAMAVIVSAFAALLGSGLAHLLITRWRMGPLAASLIAVPIFTILGGGITFFGIIIGAIVADTARSGF